MKLFHFIIRRGVRTVLLFCIALMLLWWGGPLQDRKLSSESSKILSLLDSGEIPIQSNRFYYLTGFLAPSSYEPINWGKKWLDEQKRFYANPENSATEFDFYRENKAFQNAPLKAQFLRDEADSFLEIWDVHSNLPSDREKGYIKALLAEYYSKFYMKDEDEQFQGKRNLLVKRYKGYEVCSTALLYMLRILWLPVLRHGVLL